MSGLMTGCEMSDNLYEGLSGNVMTVPNEPLYKSLLLFLAAHYA